MSGNTVIDALKWTAEMPVPAKIHSLVENIQSRHKANAKILLVTAHRRENFGQPIIEICQALLEISRSFPDAHIVYPVHLNPNIQHPVYKLLNNVNNITLIEPLDYIEFVHLQKLSHLIVTDSGGVQEEAPALGKPVLVLREVTERPEAVSAGTAKLVGTSREAIVRNVRDLLLSSFFYSQMSNAVNPYGDGFASERIVKQLLGETVTPFKVMEKTSITLPDD